MEDSTAAAAQARPRCGDVDEDLIQRLGLKRVGQHMVLPKMVVFDVDGCLLLPEAFQMERMPTVAVKGDLGCADLEGVKSLATKGMKQVVNLFAGARKVFQELYLLPEWANVKVAVASSSLDPDVTYACLKTIEIVPGVTIWDVLDFEAVGRSGALTSDKRTHFKKLRKESGIEPTDCLFFDDCNWEHHVNRLRKQLGVLGVATPVGLTHALWWKGIHMYHDHAASKQ